MKRRTFLGTLAASSVTMGLNVGPVLAQAPNAAQHPLWPLWEAWRQSYLDFSGRVVDEPQSRASHSEGQGYGMLLAAEFGDGDAFRQMADWTDANLAIRSDNLLAWRWLPDVPERVPDMNNASDGDLFYAWALLRGATRFNEPRWSRRAADIAEDLARKCTAIRPDRPGATVLLPAEIGFVDQNGTLTLNPSYMMPRALREVADHTGVSPLSLAAKSALDLMAEIARIRLVPDWLQISAAGVADADQFSANMGYEALRIPLFLAWSGERDHPALSRASDAWAVALGDGSSIQMPTVLDSGSGQVRETSGDPGYRAIAALAECAANRSFGSKMPTFTTTQPYYPATLHLFAILAQSKEYPTCIPI